MKPVFFIAALMGQLITAAQSPYLSILLNIDSVEAKGIRYKIEMKICEPKKMTERGDWFTHHTSKIDFSALKPANINCGEYFENGMPAPVSGKEEEKFSHFEFSGQVFAWEKILIFKISNWSSAALWPDMYILVPVKYKSFVTSIHLSGLTFQSGKLMFVDDYSASQDGMYLNIEQSLKDYNVLDVKKSPWKEVVGAQ